MKQLIIEKTETILIRAKDYYENNKEVLGEKAKNKYRELSEKLKKENKKRMSGENMEEIYTYRERNLSEETTQRLKEYQRNYCEAKNLT